MLGEGELAQAGVFTDFASVEDPPLRMVTAGDHTYYVVTEGPVGNKESLTCFLGNYIQRAGPAIWSEDHMTWEVGARIITPVERLVFDLYVHRSFRASETFRTYACTELFGPMRTEPPLLSWSRIRLPAQVGHIPHGTRLPEVPRHLEMTERVFETVDLDPADFQLFRAELAHPPIHSIFFYEFEALREG